MPLQLVWLSQGQRCLARSLPTPSERGRWASRAATGDRSTNHPGSVLVSAGGGHLQCEPGLTGAARAGQRRHPIPREQLPHIRDLLVAAHEIRQLSRKIMRFNNIGRPQRAADQVRTPPRRPHGRTQPRNCRPHLVRPAAHRDAQRCVRSARSRRATARLICSGWVSHRRVDRYRRAAASRYPSAATRSYARRSSSTAVSPP